MLSINNFVLVLYGIYTINFNQLC